MSSNGCASPNEATQHSGGVFDMLAGIGTLPGRAYSSGGGVFSCGSSSNGGAADPAAFPRGLACGCECRENAELDALLANPHNVASGGANKDIYGGIIRGVKVAVCIARSTSEHDVDRLRREIDTFKQVGEHPCIIRMLSHGLHESRPYLIQEAVEPIGYDLNRLVNQYSWADYPVPSSLAARLIKQIAEAVRHIHSRGVVHRDLKTENVLVTHCYDSRLIDFGVARSIGDVDRLDACYMAPEVLEGTEPLGPEVDCWGLGLLLHQMYQFSGNLVEYRHSSGAARFRRGMPSKTFPMEPAVQYAMSGLLQIAPGQRWTVQDLFASKWMSETQSTQDERGQWRSVPSKAADSRSRKNLKKFVGAPPRVAYAVCIDEKMAIASRTLGELNFGKCWTVLLVEHGRGGAIEQVPGPRTRLNAGGWVYFGVLHSSWRDAKLQHEGADEEEVAAERDEEAEAVSSLRSMLFPGQAGVAGTDLKERSTADEGSLIPFTLEFDSFVFPDHVSLAIIGSKQNWEHAARSVPASESKRREDSGSSTGKQVNSISWRKQMVSAHGPLQFLNTRSNFGINLAGILRLGERCPVWFPSPTTIVCGGDVGLVVRRPCPDGSTQPTLKDKALEALMDPDAFFEKVGAKPVSVQSLEPTDEEPSFSPPVAAFTWPSSTSERASYT